MDQDDRADDIAPDWWAVLDADVCQSPVPDDPCDGPVLPGHYADEDGGYRPGHSGDFPF